MTAPAKTVKKDSGARFEPVARSAFRTLGLPASASQAEVFEAAEALRLALKLGVGKSFDGDLAWLGAVARDEADVRDAAGRLADPPRRAAERLFWFHHPCRNPRPATLDALRRDAAALAADGGPAARHDAALYFLAALHALDPKFKEPPAWAQAFALWRETIEGEEFWSLLVAADLKGEFEQALTFAEAAELRGQTPRLVSKAIADEAARAVAAEEFALAGRAFAVLRDAPLPRTLVEEYENEVLGPFEERVEKACDAAFARTRLYADLEMLPSARKRLFDGSLHDFDRKVRPELMKLLRAAGPQGFHLRRALRHAAEWMSELGGRYRDEGWTEQAVYVYGEARALAPPGAAARVEAEAALRAMGAGAGERTEEEYAAGIARELWPRLPPAKLFADYMAPQKKEETFLGCLLQIGFYVLVVASCFALNECGIINTRRSPRFTPGPYNLNVNFNIAVPQFSPFPMPSTMPYSSLPRLTPAELRQRMRRGQAVVVDVRARGDYEAGHLPGALSVTEDEAEGRAESLRRRGRQVVCYGSSANLWKPQIVALTLRIAGVRNVAVLDGGFEAWVAEGLPTEQAAAPVGPPTEVPRAAPTPDASPPTDPPKLPPNGP